MKRLRVILLFLLLGAIVNVAVAWGIALLVTFEEMTHDFHDGISITSHESWELDRFEAFGTHFYSSHRSKGLMNLDEEELLEIKESICDLPIENVKPNWGSMDYMTDLYQTLPGPPDYVMVQEIAYEARGWPMLSLWCVRFLEVDDGSGFKQFGPRGLIAIPNLTVDQLGTRGLPLYPIWTGFVLNMLFYAAILWLLFTGTLALHRMIRRKRGLCVKCGYDLRGVDHQACPECGEDIRKGNPA